MSALDPMLTPVQIGRHELPGIWQYMLPEEFTWMQFPRERLATCEACYEVASERFRADCQCCTYFPPVPNFALGLALRDARARPKIQTLIERGSTLPLGLVPTPVQFRATVEAYSRDLFGQLPEMVCPFVEPDGFACAIYPFRNSVCSTFFCAFDHGETGEIFWMRLQALIGRLDTSLAQWAMDAVGLPHRTVVERLNGWAGRIDDVSDPVSRGWSSAVQEDLWGEWRGREVEFFSRAAEHVMTRRADLYRIACEQTFVEAQEFDRAVREWIPEEHRDMAPFVGEEPAEYEPIESLWYKVQLGARQLWELPMNEGTVRLADGVSLAQEQLPLLGATHRPVTLSHGELRWPVTEAEATLLRLFESPQVLGEAFFERAELHAVEEARALLAECLRRGVLLPQPV